MKLLSWLVGLSIAAAVAVAVKQNIDKQRRKALDVLDLGLEEDDDSEEAKATTIATVDTSSMPWAGGHYHTGEILGRGSTPWEAARAFVERYSKRQPMPCGTPARPWMQGDKDDDSPQEWNVLCPTAEFPGNMHLFQVWKPKELIV